MPKPYRPANEWVVSEAAEKSGPFTADQIRQMFERGEIKGSSYIQSNLDPDVHMQVLDLLRARSETATSLFEALQSVKDQPKTGPKPTSPPHSSHFPEAVAEGAAAPSTFHPYLPLIWGGAGLASVLTLWAGVELVKSLRPSSLTQYFCAETATTPPSFVNPIQNAPVTQATEALIASPTSTNPPQNALTTSSRPPSYRDNPRDLTSDRPSSDRPSDRDRNLDRSSDRGYDRPLDRGSDRSAERFDRNSDRRLDRANSFSADTPDDAPSTPLDSAEEDNKQNNEYKN